MAQPGTTTKAGGWAKRSAERLRAKSSGRSVLFIATRVKSEGRRSKAEGRNPNLPRPRVSVFGFRNSAFFRPSAFGLRISKSSACGLRVSGLEWPGPALERP